jgi:hypothetical protein
LPLGYTLEFHFSPNEYFTNTVLTKSFELITERDKDQPFKYENGSLYKSLGCQIDWKEGKNVTVKLSKKKQNHKGTGTIRVVTKEEVQDSFFMFFGTRTADGVRPCFKPKDPKEEKPVAHEHEDGESCGQDETAEHFIEYIFEMDYELGQLIKENIIPKALLFYTGEMNDAIMEGNDSDEDDDDEDDVCSTNIKNQSLLFL